MYITVLATKVSEPVFQYVCVEALCVRGNILHIYISYHSIYDKFELFVKLTFFVTSDEFSA